MGLKKVINPARNVDFRSEGDEVGKRALALTPGETRQYIFGWMVEIFQYDNTAI